MKNFAAIQFIRFLLRILCLVIVSGTCTAPVGAAIYDTKLSDELMHGSDLCADAPCRDVMPMATQFSLRKGSPSYVEARAADGKLVGYVFLCRRT